MKTLLQLLVPAMLLASAMGQEAQPRPDLTDPTVLKLKALLPLKQQAKFGKFLLSQEQFAEFGKFVMGQGQFAHFGEFMGSQKRFAMMADKQMLLLVRAEQTRPNYPGNAYAAVQQDLWASFLAGDPKAVQAVMIAAGR